MIGVLHYPRVARGWHALTALVALLSVGTQLILVVSNINIGFGASNAPVGQRVVEFFSYFTIESNIFTGIATGMLAVRPDRDGTLWRILRIGSMFGITVTLIVYHVILSPLASFTGIASASNIGLHYVVPILAILGWIFFGPHPRVTWRVLLLAMIWPAAYIVLTVVQGMITGFYPYPFVNVAKLGVGQVVVNAVGVVLLLLAVGVVYLFLDWVIGRRRRSKAH